MSGGVPQKLNEKMRRFAEIYDGNGAAAAEAVGINKEDSRARACLWLKNSEVQELINARRSKVIGGKVRTRIERQMFWSQVMDDGTYTIENRLKASELLGRSEGDFLVRVEASVKRFELPPELTVEELREIARRPVTFDEAPGTSTEVVDEAAAATD